MSALQEYIKNFAEFSPISCVPTRYETITVVTHPKEFYENTTNVLRVMITAHALTMRVSKSMPYTITAQLVDSNNKPTNTEISFKFFAGKPMWWNKLFPLYSEAIISGKPKFYKGDTFFIHPKKITDAEKYFTQTITITPVYKKHGIKIDDKTIQTHLVSQIPFIQEIPQPTETKINFHLGIEQKFTVHSALMEIHQPKTPQTLNNANTFLSAVEYI